MKYNLYGKKMFVVDLAIVTIWAFFNLRFPLWNGWPMLIILPMRFALCFQMQRKSPWTLYSSIVFMLCGGALAFTDRAFYPFKRIAYYIGAWIGSGKDVVDAFGGVLDQDLRVWLIIFGAMLSLWIFVLPIVIGLFQRNIKDINWKRKWILIYGSLAVLISLPIFYEEIPVGAFMLGFFLCFMPVAYWTIYNRNQRSAFNLICNYRPLVRYVAFIVLLALCLYIGMERWEFVKAIALITMPPIFYALICRCQDIKPLTRHAVALSICGVLYCFIFTAPEWFKIVTLSISVILAIYIAVDFVYRYGHYWTGVALFLLPTVVIAPLTLGMNPYVVLDVDSVSASCDGYAAQDGLFVIEKKGKYGLRDRYGLVLEPDYERFEELDKWGRYITTNTCNGSMLSNNRYGVLDLDKYEFIVDPNEVAVMKIVQTGKQSFNLYAPDNTIFATLHLRGYDRETGEYIRETYIEPYHAPAELNLEENPELADWGKNLGDSQQGDNAES